MVIVTYERVYFMQLYYGSDCTLRKKQREVIKSLSPEVFTGVYAEIAAELDCETAVRIFNILRGQTVNFPQKLYSSDYVRTFVSENHGKYSARELSKMFGYSERRIRQFISEEQKRKT